MLFPEGGVVTVVDKRKWAPGREELGASGIITVSVDSIAPTDESVLKHVVIKWILWVLSLK